MGSNKSAGLHELYGDKIIEIEIDRYERMPDMDMLRKTVNTLGSLSLYDAVQWKEGKVCFRRYQRASIGPPVDTRFKFEIPIEELKKLEKIDRKEGWYKRPIFSDIEVLSARDKGEEPDPNFINGPYVIYMDSINIKKLLAEIGK